MSVYTNNFFGIDMGTTAIRIVQVFRRGDTVELLAAGSLPNTINLHVEDDQKKLDLLSSTIEQLRKECGVTTKNVALALPEAHVFSHLTTMAKLPDNKMDEAVEWEAENFIPLPRQEVELDRMIIPIVGENDKVLVFMLASPLVKLNRLIKVVEKAGFNVVTIESNVIAAGRVLITKEFDKKTVVLLHVGYENTEFGIFKNGLLIASRNIPLGSNTINKTLYTQLSLEWALAEKTKLNIKNITGVIQEKVLEQVKITIDSMAKEVFRSIEYFKEKFEDIEVSDIILTGRGAMLNDFSWLLQDGLLQTSGKEQYSPEIRIGNPWATIEKSKAIVEKSPETVMSFSIAVGLAMRKL